MVPIYDADAKEREMYEWINNASLYDLQYRWRFSAPGDPIFVGEVGDYYVRRMADLREKDPGQYTANSKRMGF